jgi:photosystem II stability/assembly factor-like uncharacterized protein
VGGLPTNKTVNGFAVEPSNPKVMYAAMRDGLFKSVDAGETWKRIGNKLKNLATVDGTIYVSADAGMKWKRQQ